MSSRELPSPDENPFESPRQPVKFTLPQAPDDPERRRRKRIQLALLGIVLVPIAGFIGGSIGCGAGFIVIDSVQDYGVAFLSMISLAALGALAGAGLITYLLVREANRP